ncbi:zinc finger BED domain-containing protein RICESLEEPER 2-like [Cynara cardunculus var. scolymus]|uniref:zinc finger BED domain-containing protein RICESLEEPER 2-like n=1 Tax=Cynara cardunculus var. scolymus TaxID=59895 RepID=UPI000D623E28|nr:zinc finger BED domain-containing protein RICESLEEPER 2-like [Cynara cardunculus var. scolymus]
MPIGSNISPETEVSEPANKRLKYVVWNHFEAIYIDGLRRFAKCKYCNKQMTGRPNDGTTHLKDHFKICPRKVTKDIRQHILVQEQTAKDGKTSLLSNYNFSAESSRDDLAKIIILHDYPLSIVEHHGFPKYSNGLQPLFKVPCRATIKSDIMKIYETKRGGVLRCLEENKSRIALTSDMWTAGNQNKGYMALTACYIDANRKLQNRIISFLHVPSPHTADALSQVMFECFMDWNIDNKLSTLTLDNCSTNDALVDRLLEKLLPQDEGFDILMWWKCDGVKFPIMQRIARDVLAIPISTVASESAFSMSGNKIKNTENQEDLIKRLDTMKMLIVEGRNYVLLGKNLF